MPNSGGGLFAVGIEKDDNDIVFKANKFIKYIVCYAGEIINTETSTHYSS